jgi:hypothetical protein
MAPSFAGNIARSKRSALLFCGFLILSVCACKKDNAPKSVTALLMNKWSVFYESAVVPSCLTPIRLVYVGQPTDYYNFRSNDSLDISLSGTLFQVNNPSKVSRKYALLNDSSIMIYSPASTNGDTASIIKISSDSLVLTTLTTVSFANLCTNTVDTYTVQDTLRLYR